MRMSVLTVLFSVVAAFPVLASSKKSRDAETDGFKGVVKSVSTERQVVSPQPSQPDGPAIIYPIWCEVCEYDEDGNVVLRGRTGKPGLLEKRLATFGMRTETLGNRSRKTKKARLTVECRLGGLGRLRKSSTNMACCNPETGTATTKTETSSSG